MLSFGFLTLNKKTEHGYFTEVAKRAAPLFINVFCFSPSDINPKTVHVHGKMFHATNQQWEDAVFPIPTYIYDRCFYPTEKELKKYAPIVSWLKKRSDISFIGHGLPDKWNIYNVLKAHPLLKYYVPITEKVKTYNDVFQMLEKHKKIILKPNNGSQGRGIVALNFLEGHVIELITQRHNQRVHKIFSNKDHLKRWLKQLVTLHSYLVQPYLELSDQDLCPFDIRILLQKNAENRWCEVGRGIRKGQKGHIISNLHGGGNVRSFLDWLGTNNRPQQTLLIDDIHTITEHLPHTLEQSFGPLFELGIDIGVAKDGTIWVLDTNSKPGHKTILQTNQAIANQLYQAPLEFCKQLSLQRR